MSQFRSGIGFEISLTLARNGFFTYATMRNLDKSKNIVALVNAEKLPLEVVQLDINDDRSIRNVIAKIADTQRAIDVLVNNADIWCFILQRVSRLRIGFLKWHITSLNYIQNQK